MTMIDTIRPYEPEDSGTLTAMLNMDGFVDKDINFPSGYTMVQECDNNIRGFFTLEFCGPWPHLRYFFVDPQYRKDHKQTYDLMGALRKMVLLEMGSGRLIVHARNDRISRLVRAYFRTAPYDRSDDGAWLFSVEV